MQPMIDEIDRVAGFSIQLHDDNEMIRSKGILNKMAGIAVIRNDIKAGRMGVTTYHG